MYSYDTRFFILHDAFTMKGIQVLCCYSGFLSVGLQRGHEISAVRVGNEQAWGTNATQIQDMGARNAPT